MITEAKFYLEKRKDKETGKIASQNVPIFLFYSFGGQRLQLYTGIRTDAFKWDENSMKIKKGFQEAAEVNKELAKLKSKVEDIHDRAKALGEELTLQEFRARIKGKGNPVKSGKSFNECWNEYVKSSQLTKSAGTIAGIKSAYNIFTDFSKRSGHYLSFNNIDQEFYNDFLEYCFTVRNIKNTFTGTLIRTLKAFLNWATEQGYNTKLDFRKKSFKKLTEEPEIIFLTYEELMELYNFNLSAFPHLEQVRDVFCFGCFTGMRHSDIAALSPEHIQKDFINYRVVKTSEINTIPLNPYSQKILNKYRGKLGNKCLPVVNIQSTNEYLREAFKKVKLSRKVQKTNFQGAKRISITAPLHEVITFHISKKTFMTNFLAKGGSLTTAMAITGNKTFKAASRYFKVVDKLKSEEMNRVFGEPVSKGGKPKRANE